MDNGILLRLRRIVDQAREELAGEDAALRWLIPALVLISLPALVFLVLGLT